MTEPTSAVDYWTLKDIAGIVVLAAGVLALVTLLLPWAVLNYRDPSGVVDSGSITAFEAGRGVDALLCGVVLLAAGGEVALAKLITSVRVVFRRFLSGWFSLGIGVWMAWIAVTEYLDGSGEAGAVADLRAELGSPVAFTLAVGPGVYIFGLAALLAIVAGPFLASQQTSRPYSDFGAWKFPEDHGFNAAIDGDGD